MGPNSMESRNMNYNTGSGIPPSSFNSMPPSIVAPPRMPYPNRNPMQGPAPLYNPRFASYPRSRRRPHQPVIIHRRYRSRRCRPVVRITRADSCISISTCSTISSCSSRCYRSCSYSREHTTSQQQPIILLPIQCQQQPVIAAPIQGQSQPIVLPSTQVQQQQHFAVPSISNISSTPVTIQPLNSMSQVIPIGKPQQFRAGPIQYVQAIPQSATTSQLQFISAKPPSSTAPQRVLVNSTNKKQSTVAKPIQRSVITRN